VRAATVILWRRSIAAPFGVSWVSTQEISMEMYDLFDRYLTSITPSESELSRARTHRDTVASRIDLDGFVERVNSGSYIKKTALRPLEDIDLFVGFDVRDYEHDSHRVVSRIHRLLLEKFSSTDVRIQRHSVGVAFTDGIRVDVVPGFQLRTRPGYYRMRDRYDDRWRETNVTLHRAFFKRRQAADPRHRDMVKLVKAWKRGRRTGFGSYLMELLVSRAFLRGIPHGRDVALHQFFEWIAKTRLQKPIIFDDNYAIDEAQYDDAPLVVLDPATWRNNVASGLSKASVEELVSVADRCRARAGTALAETSRVAASAIWREILPGFPAP
jgi:tRNA nucleotidyltransferase (CCA-adding enzyme)